MLKINEQILFYYIVISSLLYLKIVYCQDNEKHQHTENLYEKCKHTIYILLTLTFFYLIDLYKVLMKKNEMTRLVKECDKNLTKCASYNECKQIFIDKIELIKSIEVLSAYLNNLNRLINQSQGQNRKMRLFGKISNINIGQALPLIRI
jgi:hypothetical protein